MRSIGRPMPIAADRLRRVAALNRATGRARAMLRPGDRLHVTRCGGSKAVVTFTGFDSFFPDWICSATRNDIHAFHIYKVNGAPVSFDDPPGFSPPPFEVTRMRMRRAVERWRFDWHLWRAVNMPRVRAFNQCTSTEDWEAEGKVLALRWRCFIVELHFLRTSRFVSHDDDLPF